MARIHGKNAYVTFEDSTGASQNLTADGNNSTLNESVKNPEMTAYGNVAVARAGSGIQDAKFTYEGWANIGTSNNFQLLQAAKGQIRGFVFGPGGSSASSLKISACMLVDDVEIKAPLETIETCKASLSLASGSITTSCFP